MTRTATVEIKDGVEWFSSDPNNQDCQCARCGSSCNFRDCWTCGSAGEVEEDCGDDAWPETDYVLCRSCGGTGGSWHCISGPEWCNAHPMEGRESIKSTALSSQGWDD